MKVEISPFGNGGYHVYLDGVDISSVVVENGVLIEWVHGRPHVDLTLRPDELFANLDPAAVEAAQQLLAR